VLAHGSKQALDSLEMTGQLTCLDVNASAINENQALVFNPSLDPRCAARLEGTDE
jgi:hypothetical protein